MLIMRVLIANWLKYLDDYCVNSKNSLWRQMKFKGAFHLTGKTGITSIATDAVNEKHVAGKRPKSLWISPFCLSRLAMKDKIS